MEGGGAGAPNGEVLMLTIFEGETGLLRLTGEWVCRSVMATGWYEAGEYLHV